MELYIENRLRTIFDIILSESQERHLKIIIKTTQIDPMVPWISILCPVVQCPVVYGRPKDVHLLFILCHTRLCF